MQHVKWAITHIRLFRDFWKIYLGSPKFLTLWNGVKFSFLDRRQVVPVISEVWLHHVYGNLSGLSKNPIIFDVGAHIGTFSLFAARKYPNAKIYAFEPDPTNFSTLTENLKLNGVTNVIANNVAVGNSTGMRTLYIHGTNSGTNSMYAKTNHQIEVPCTTLAAFCVENGISQIDFLKLDCEGCEPEIMDVLPPFVQQVVAEWGSNPRPKHPHFTPARTVG